MASSDTRATEHWARPYWQASDEDARLLFFVFGQFTPRDEELANALRLPAGIATTRYAHDALRDWEGYPLAGSLGAVFAVDAPHALAVAREAPEVLRIAGSVHDPANLDYLRDTLNALTWLLDHGGVAVVDPPVSGLFDRAHWRGHFLRGTSETLREHVLVLCDADPHDDTTQCVHTRGMRKFARPDVSLTGVPTSEVNRAGALCTQLVDMLALGGHFANGQVLTIDGLPGPLVARLAGDANDPRFYNTHVELRWPSM